MIGARATPNETSLLWFVDSVNIDSMVSGVRRIGVALSTISTPLFAIVPRFCSCVPANPVDGGTATCSSASRVFLL